jgi:glycosyltransferase involved in cell wall biosynthesis
VRILFVNSAREVGGGPTSALDLATGLADAGHRVIVACHPRSAIMGRLHDRPQIVALPIAIRAELNPWRVVQLRRAMRKAQPDVVLADKRKDVKLCFWARGRPSSGPAIVHRHGAPSPLRDGAVYRFVWPRLQAMIVNSEAMKREMLRRTPWLAAVPLEVIHNGKDLSRYRPMPEERAAMRASLGIGEGEYVACFHGSALPRKRVGDLLEAAAGLAGRLEVHVLVIGEGPDANDLTETARTRGIRATFPGIRTDIPQVLSAADVSVHLSVAEGFSNSVVEALACGLPVIASDAHSHPEQVADAVTGRLVPPGDLGALCEALREFADPTVRGRASAAARAYAEARLGFDRMIEAYVEVLTRAATARA